MSIFQIFASELEAAWGNVEGAVQTDAVEFLNSLRNIATKVGPSQFVLLNTFIEQAIKDAETSDIGDIESDLLNLAQGELAWVRTLGSDVLQALIAIAVARQAQLAA